MVENGFACFTSVLNWLKVWNRLRLSRSRAPNVKPSRHIRTQLCLPKNKNPGSCSLIPISKANGSSPLSLNHHRTIAIISLARLPTTTSLPSSPSTLLAKLQHYSTLATTKSLPLTINTSFITSPTLFATQSPLRHPQSSPSVFFKNVEPMQEHFFATFIPQKVHSILALFDMPNLNRFDILSISIFCKIALSISIFSKITISISIFSNITLSISILLSIFSTSPYRYRYFWNYLIDIDIFQNCPIDIDIFNFSISISISISIF